MLASWPLNWSRFTKPTPCTTQLPRKAGHGFMHIIYLPYYVSGTSKGVSFTFSLCTMRIPTSHQALNLTLALRPPTSIAINQPGSSQIFERNSKWHKKKTKHQRGWRGMTKLEEIKVKVTLNPAKSQ